MEFKKSTVEELIEQDVIEKPMDGNHGSIHPKTKDFTDVGIPFITAADIHSDKVDIEKANKLSEKDAQKLKKGFAKKRDVLLTHKASVGRTAVVNNMEYDYIILSPQVTYYRIKDTTTLLPEYLYLYFKSNYFNQIINQWAGGSTRKYIGITAQKKLPILYPSIKNQKKIVDFIMTFEYKVQVNKKIIANLEELSQTLFKRWFVDFEFPDENGNPYKSSGGNMVDSELGEIPKGWNIKRLSDICIVTDGTHDSPKQTTEGYPLVTSKHLNKFDIDFSTTKLISKEDFTSINQRSKVEKNDILLSMIGTIGKLHFVNSNSINYAIKNVGLIKTSQIDYSTYIYNYINSQNTIDYIQQRTSGSTQQYISLKNLRSIPIISPTSNILKTYIDRNNNFFEKINQKIKENVKLIELRNTLLPKLMSGEIEIPDDIEVMEDELSI
ncbi:TPA: restriction endonuclease subunit S [Staphylococcus aureus]|nr:restriction endonuclease subunit S [Staphylococcus aureus]